MKSPNYISPTLIALVSSIFILSSANFMTANANDGIHSSKRFFKMSPRVTSDDYKAKTVILKIKQDHRAYCRPEQISMAPIHKLLNDVGATGIQRMFPHAEKPIRELNKYGLKYADLTLVYEFEYTGDKSVEQVVNDIYALGLVEYAQPYYIHHEFFTPNDPQVGSQYHISSVKAYQAWDVQQGDPNITVAIIDSGSDIDHEDFLSQFKYNTADPVDGSDNDGDGYIDNNLGWDFAGDDNNTQMAGSNHGVHVAGCAVAATNNGIGVAGPAFGCTYLPVKAGDGGTIDFGYVGITYAADHGASVINCSWGGAGGGELGQDVIDYATINMDALVVAAAGNDAVEDLFYPASYNYVLNVGSTASNDTKSGFSNYGYAIDVCAPGSSIWATDNNDGYTSMSGTSMASPVAAGCAALVRSQYLTLDAIQVGEQLKVTCDDIYPVNQSFYQDKLGAGRINLYSAVSGITQPSIVMTERNVSDGEDEAFVVGDTLSIDGMFIDFLAPTGSVTGTLTAQSANVQIVDGTTSLGAFAPFGGTADNFADPFKVVILSGATLNEKVTFELELTDGSYTTSIFFQIIVNVDYINITINDVATSITSKSLIGFNDFSVQLEGLGFIYPYSILGTGSNILFDCGLMVGIPNNVSDNVRTTGGGTDVDFAAVNNVQRLPVPITSEFDVIGDFDDGGTGTLGIDIAQKAFAWSEVGHRKYVIVEYTIKNNSGSTLSDLYAGLYADWDINDYSKNIGATDENKRLGYIYDTQSAGVYAGMQVVSTSGDFVHNAMFNNSTDDPGGTGVYPNVSYETADKYNSLTTMDLNSGGTGTGKDVSNVVSSGPFTIAAGDSVVVAYALMAGDDLADITLTADSAYTKYNPCTDLTASVTTTDEVCGASDGTATAVLNSGLEPYTYLWSGGETSSSVSGLAAGSYDVTVTTANGCVDIDVVTVNGSTPLVATTTATNPACGTSTGEATITVTSGTTPYSYLWDTDAGSQTAATATSLSAGAYEVTVTDGLGCEYSFNANVSNTGAGTPTITQDQTIDCAGGTDGAITASITGGTSPYTYLWNDGATTATSSGLTAGTYTVQITDANGCIVIAQTTLTEPVGTTATTSSTDDDGSGNGTATVNVSGGTGPFTYAWNDGANQSTTTASALAEGTYSVDVTDASGCVTTYTIIVSGVTGIGQTDESFVTSIYPNPNSGVFTVVFGSGAENNTVELSFRNIIGQEVMTKQVLLSGQREIQLNVATLDKGAYFLTVTGNDSAETFKILVQ